jgi:hypothetical protein
MAYDVMDTGCAKDGEPSSDQEGIPAELFSPVSLLSNPPCSEMRLSVLTGQGAGTRCVALLTPSPSCAGYLSDPPAHSGL